MGLRVKLEIAGAILVLALLGIGFRSWLAEHDSRLRMEAETAATKTALSKLQADRVAEAQAEAERDRVRDATNAQTLAEVAKLKTPAQVAGYVNREVAGAQAVVSTPPVAAGAKPDAPAPKPLVTLDAGALDARLASCRVSETNLTACQQDLAGRARSAADADQQIKLLKKQNGDLQGELGHTKWAHAWNNYLKPAIALAIGVVAGRASK
jgi:hypothetical protein